MSEWKNININTNLIEAETEKSVLIKMPHSSKFDGFVFWHPAKLVRSGRHSDAVSIGYTDDFKFNLKKYGHGRFNCHDIIDCKEITVKDFETAFGIIDENITAPVHKGV